jgi:hypothetical protein
MALADVLVTGDQRTFRQSYQERDFTDLTCWQAATFAPDAAPAKAALRSKTNPL